MLRLTEIIKHRPEFFCAALSLDCSKCILGGKTIILSLTLSHPFEFADGFAELKTKDNIRIMSVTKQTIFRLIIEVLIYAALVSIYLALVLHFLVGWLKELFTKEPDSLCLRGNSADDRSGRRTGASGVQSGPCHPATERVITRYVFSLSPGFISIRFTWFSSDLSSGS